MLVIDDAKNKLLNMKSKMLELSVGDFADNLDIYRKTAQQIDAECYETLIQKIKNSNYNNLPLEEQLKFFTEIIDDYNDLYNQQVIYKDEYDKYAQEPLALSDLNNILIEDIQSRKSQIEGYLINAKNLKSNKIEIDRLNQKLIATTKEKEDTSIRIDGIRRRLKEDILSARGRIYGLNGSLEVTSIALELKRYNLDLGELINDSFLLDKVYSESKIELDDIKETLDTALSLPNKDEAICEKYMIDVLKSNYKFNLVELIKEVFNVSDDYALFKDSLYKIDDLLKEIKNNLKELKIKFYINPFDGIKIGNYLKVSLEFKDYDVDIANIKKTITYLTKMVEEMESINSKTVLSINDEVTILREPENTIFIDVNDNKANDEDNNEVIYQILKNDVVKANQVIKIVSPSEDFMMGRVKQKTSGVINRVYEMMNYKGKVISTVPDLVIEKMMPSSERVVNNDMMPEIPLFEELPPFLDPQLFEERKDGDIFNDKEDKNMKIDLSNNKKINAFTEQLINEINNDSSKKIEEVKDKNVFWIPKEDNNVVSLEDYQNESLVKKRAA